MNEGRLTFRRVSILSQEFQSDKEHLSALIDFDFEMNGKQYSGLTAQVKQIVGSKLEEEEQLEICPCSEYPGPFEAFRLNAELYFHSKTGQKATGGVRYGPNAEQVTMKNVTIAEKPLIVFIPLTGPTNSW